MPDADVERELPTWPGMPDPHRHNPFAVALALVIMFGTAWVATFGAVLWMIGTFR